MGEQKKTSDHGSAKRLMTRSTASSEQKSIPNSDFYCIDTNGTGTSEAISIYRMAYNDWKISHGVEATLGFFLITARYITFVTNFK